MNGVKHLILGNHDYVPKIQSNFYWWGYYSEIQTKPTIIAFHYPIEEWNEFYRGSVHIHAHTHSHDKKGNVHIKNRVNVSVEAWNYTPVAIEDVLKVW